MPAGGSHEIRASLLPWLPLALPLDGATWRAYVPTRGSLAGVGSTDGALASLVEAFPGTPFILTVRGGGG